jgi:uncharacterized lipoprotein YajG
MICLGIAGIAMNFTRRRRNMRNAIIMIVIIMMAGCAKQNPHPDHIPGISCPKQGHGKCPFGCDG